VGWKTHFFYLFMNNISDIAKKNLPSGMILLDIVQDHKSNFIRFIVDSENKITISDTAKYAKILKRSDEINSIYPGGCRIEVSTPGIDQPLKMPFQFKKNINRAIDIILVDNDDGTISFSGIIKSANDINFTVQSGEKMMTVVYDQVKKANLILEFN